MNDEPRSNGGILLSAGVLLAAMLAVAPAGAEEPAPRQTAGRSVRSPKWLRHGGAQATALRPDSAQMEVASRDDVEENTGAWRRHPKTRDSQPIRPRPLHTVTTDDGEMSDVRQTTYQAHRRRRQRESLGVPVVQSSQEPEVIPSPEHHEPEQLADDTFDENIFLESSGCDACGGCADGLADGDLGLICPSCYQRWRNFHPLCGGWDCGCPWNWSDEFSVFAGAQSFAGPLDLGQNGNFGFHAGANWGGPLWHRNRIGYQLGVRSVHSNLSGADVAGQRISSRNQLFATGGLFFRAPCHHGWQFGVAWDWMQDDYYVDPSLQQMRGQLSYLTFCGHEIGAWTTIASDDKRQDQIGDRFKSLDLYALFYRYNSPEGYEGRIWGGATDDGDGMAGVDLRIPLSLKWSITGGANYIIPRQGRQSLGPSEEAWGISLTVVWHPFRRKCDGSNNRGAYRPMFDVADNSVFIVGRDL